MSPSYCPTSPSYCPASPSYSPSSPGPRRASRKRGLSPPHPAAAEAEAACKPHDEDYECPDYGTKDATVRVHAELAFCVRYAKDHPEMLTREAMTDEMYDDFEYHGISDSVDPKEPDEHAADAVWTSLVQEYDTAGCGSDMLAEMLDHVATATGEPVPSDDASECWLDTADVKWFIDKYTAIMMEKRREDEEDDE
jgi:hypothetical protein